MNLLLFSKGLCAHYTAIATAEDIQLAVAEGHVEDDTVGILATVPYVDQLGKTFLKIAVTLHIYLTIFDVLQHRMVQLQILNNLI